MSLCSGTAPLGAWEGLAAVGWGDVEQSPQNICLSLTAEPCSAEKQVCRTLLPCSYGSTSQEGHLPCSCSPRGVTGHPWLWGTGSAAGWEGKWVRRESLGVVCWDCAPLSIELIAPTLSPCAPACVGSSAVVRDGHRCRIPRDSAACLRLSLQSSGKGLWLLPRGRERPCALSLQPPQAGGPLCPQLPCTPCQAGAASSRGAVPTAVLHPLGFGICDCSNYLLQ